MTEEEMNAAVAECCGWVITRSGLSVTISKHGAGACTGRHDHFDAVAELVKMPNYVADNAMREALLTLTPADQDRYAAVLSQIVDGRRIDLGATRIETTTKVLFASARQQAQAFLVVRGKWREA